MLIYSLFIQGRTKMFSKKLIFIWCVVFSLSVQGNQLTNETTIKFLESWTSTSGDLYVKTNESSVANPASCSNSSVYVLPKNAPEITQSMLLASVHANSTLKLTIYGGGCYYNRPQIVAVKIIN